jgi:hypothetical protein
MSTKNKRCQMVHIKNRVKKVVDSDQIPAMKESGFELWSELSAKKREKFLNRMGAIK